MQRLRGIVAKLVHQGLHHKIGTDADLIRDLGFDALGLVALACYVEDEFDVTVPAGADGEWRTVGQVEAWLRGHCKGLAEAVSA